MLWIGGWLCQSGKTAHFSGLLSRAIDSGFTFVIILSGILNDLRRQTQLRLEKDVFGSMNNFESVKSVNPIWLTTESDDISSEVKQIIDQDLSTAIEKQKLLSQ